MPVYGQGLHRAQQGCWAASIVFDCAQPLPGTFTSRDDDDIMACKKEGHCAQDTKPKEDYIMVIDADSILRMPFYPEHFNVTRGADAIFSMYNNFYVKCGLISEEQAAGQL